MLQKHVAEDLANAVEHAGERHVALEAREQHRPLDAAGTLVPARELGRRRGLAAAGVGVE